MRINEVLSEVWCKNDKRKWGYEELTFEELYENAKSVYTEAKTKYEWKEDLINRIEDLESECKDKDQQYGVYCRASSIMGTVADKNTEIKLTAITGVINKALALLFPDGNRKISIQQTMYRNAYPHFNVILTADNGVERTFKQSGTGLAQVVSFLFTACLIDARGGRKIMVMDELLNGLHPDAKQIIKELIVALTPRFQFVIVEYGINIGKQYIVEKRGGTSNVFESEADYFA